jgi:hypothetical protein
MTLPQSIQYKLFFAILIITVLDFNVFSQLVTPNDSFEGFPQMHVPPQSWNNCHLHNATVDTQPGPFNNTKPASHGNTYVSMVTRAVNTPGSFESAWSELLLKFEPGKCYTLLIDLSLSNQFMASTWDGNFYFNTPCRFQIFGASNNCGYYATNELLWDSGVLENYDWQTFEINISPSDVLANRILLRPYFADENVYTNSVVLVDNIRYKESPELLNESNGSFFLPNWAEDISWYFNGELIEDASGLEIPFFMDGDYQARFYDSEGCLYISEKSIAFDFNSITMYPNPVKDDLFIEFLSEGEHPIRIKVFDAIGKHVFDLTYSTEKGKNLIPINLHFLAPGNYSIVVERVGQSTYTHKFIIHQ